MISEEGFASSLVKTAGVDGGLSDCQVEMLARHYELLCRWNKVLNLTSIGDLEEAVARHYGESLFLGALLPRRGMTVLDVGSGAGFPGFPMAVQNRENRYVLVESHRRKAVFLREASRELPNVRISAARAEQFSGNVDWVVSRAVKAADVVKCARRLGAAIGLLLGERDVEAVVGLSGYSWGEPVRLPGGARRMALLGQPAG